jgi:hypothetical protein
MSFTDPQTVTISGATTPLPRVNLVSNGAEYLSADGLIKLSASNAYGRRTRRVLRIDHSKVTADPFRPTENSKVSMSNYLVFDLPPFGYTSADALAVYVGLKTQFSAASDALIVKLLGGES